MRRILLGIAMGSMFGTPSACGLVLGWYLAAFIWRTEKAIRAGADGR